MVAGFEWETRSRLAFTGGSLTGCVLLSDRPTVQGRIARLEVAALDPTIDWILLKWALAAAGDIGCEVASVWRRRGREGRVAELGFRLARPFWRLDRPDLEEIPTPPWPSGYHLLTYRTSRVPDSAWLDVFNRSFSEHWRHTPMHHENWRQRLEAPLTDRDLYLMALGPDGHPAALAICLLRPPDEWSPIPVGIVESVGTLPNHRRRGLGTALTAEGLQRLRERGACSASLYVDGQNPTRAQDIYFRLGFAIGWEYEVWERPPA